MAILNYLDGYNGTMKVGNNTYSVETWSGTITGGMTEVSASKNSGWTVHRRGMKKFTGSATVVFETDVPTLATTGPVPGNMVFVNLVADSGKEFRGNVIVGDATFNWDPGQPAKISLTFGNADELMTNPG